MADIAKTISVINQMMADSIIENYALGGATAVIFYTEPIATEDVDIFVHLKPGGNPFMDYSVPEAIIKLKQGFGRLIRSKTDTGIVVILDSRVKTKRYGRLFLDALPECRTMP